MALSGKERQTEALRASTLLATGTANYWIAQGHGFVRRRWLGASQLLARRFSRLVDRLALTACFKHASATHTWDKRRFPCIVGRSPEQWILQSVFQNGFSLRRDIDDSYLRQWCHNQGKRELLS